jgi:hypothetical protein
VNHLSTRHREEFELMSCLKSNASCNGSLATATRSIEEHSYQPSASVSVANRILTTTRLHLNFKIFWELLAHLPGEAFVDDLLDNRFVSVDLLWRRGSPCCCRGEVTKIALEIEVRREDRQSVREDLVAQQIWMGRKRGSEKESRRQTVRVKSKPVNSES